MKILISGGCGFVGSTLANALREDEVLIADDLSNGLKSNVDDKGRVWKVDVTSSEFVENAIDYNPEIIYHLACHPRSFSFEKPYRDLEVNAGGMVNVIEVAKKCGSRIVFSSNSGIYDTSILPIDEIKTLDKPTSPYDLNKQCSENYLKMIAYHYQIPYVIFRFATVYGPRQRLSENWKPVIRKFIDDKITGKQSIITGNGSQTRDFIYVDDVVSALLLAKNAINKTYPTMILATNVETSIRNVYNLVSKISGKESVCEYTDSPLGEIQAMRYHAQYAERMLGWRPTVMLSDGIGKTISWLLENEYKGKNGI